MYLNLPVEGNRAGRVGSDVSLRLGRLVYVGFCPLSSWSASVKTTGLLLNIAVW